MSLSYHWKLIRKTGSQGADGTSKVSRHNEQQMADRSKFMLQRPGKHRRREYIDGTSSVDELAEWRWHHESTPATSRRNSARSVGAESRLVGALGVVVWHLRTWLYRSNVYKIENLQWRHPYNNKQLFEMSIHGSAFRWSAHLCSLLDDIRRLCDATRDGKWTSASVDEMQHRVIVTHRRRLGVVLLASEIA